MNKKYQNVDLLRDNAADTREAKNKFFSMNHWTA